MLSITRNELNHLVLECRSAANCPHISNCPALGLSNEQVFEETPDWLIGRLRHFPIQPALFGGSGRKTSVTDCLAAHEDAISSPRPGGERSAEGQARGADGCGTVRPTREEPAVGTAVQPEVGNASVAANNAQEVSSGTRDPRVTASNREGVNAQGDVDETAVFAANPRGGALCGVAAARTGPADSTIVAPRVVGQFVDNPAKMRHSSPSATQQKATTSGPVLQAPLAAIPTQRASNRTHAVAASVSR